jgi:DNA polymerase III alpha subunit
MTYAAATITTWFSLLHSTIAPDVLLDAAARYQLSAVGIVDQATTLAHARLAQAARATAVHVAYGTTLRMEDGYVLRPSPVTTLATATCVAPHLRAGDRRGAAV